MKKLNLILILLVTLTISAQSVVEITYLDIPATKIGEFLKSHKKISVEKFRNFENFFGSILCKLSIGFIIQPLSFFICF